MALIHRFSAMANCYLISGDKDAVLVDTGTLDGRDKLLEKLKAQPLRLIVLTHGHIDHVANAAFLARELHVPIAMNHADLPLLKDTKAFPMQADTTLGHMLLMMTKRKDEVEAFTPDIDLGEGMSLTEYGIDAVVLALPGHTPGSIGLLVDEDKIIVGDAMMNTLRPTGARIYVDKDEMLRSVARIEALHATSIYVGHGKPIRAYHAQH